MEPHAPTAPFTAQDVRMLVRWCAAHAKDGHRGNFVVLHDALYAASGERGVLVCTANAAGRKRLANAIVEASGQPSSMRQTGILPLLRRSGIGVVVVNAGDNLWHGLTGKALATAKAELKYLANVSGARFVVLGGKASIAAVLDEPSLAWRFAWPRGINDFG